jgi:hypothetical protein
MEVGNLPTHFGKLSFAYTVRGKGATLTLPGDAQPPGGLVLRLPASPKAEVKVEGKAVIGTNGDFNLPPSARLIQLDWQEP